MVTGRDKDSFGRAFRLLWRLTVAFFTIAAALAAVCPRCPGATLTVTNLADSGPGTLRERIALATTNDVIQFGVFGTILLNSELVISKSVVVRGPGATALQISGNNHSRVFNIVSGSVGISSLVVSDGRVTGTNGAAGRNGENAMGGAIRVGPGASLGLSSVTISNSSAIGGQGGPQNQFGSSGNGGNALGGAIANLGTLLLVAANLTGNTAAGGMGGLITDGASPGVGGQAWGGGIYTEGPATVTIVTVSDNHAIAGSGFGGTGTALGGGLYVVTSLSLNVSTVASNSASGGVFDMGGGIYSAGNSFIRDVTIFGNQAAFGGGLSGTADIGNTILARNSAISGPDGFGNITSSDYNFIQDPSDLTLSGTTTHNIVGRDPMLNPVQHESGYGIGSILLFIPRRGSPVIDQGNTFNSDQFPRQRPFDSASVANAAGGNGSDIGAIEYFPESPMLFIQRVAGGAAIHWSTNDSDFRLESTTDLSVTNWSTVQISPAIVGDQFYVTNATAGARRFYRLSAP